MSEQGVSTRVLSRSLAGYLCGTHSRLLGRRSGVALDPERLAAHHSSLVPPRPSSASVLCARTWAPEGDAEALRPALAELVDLPQVSDIIVFGSHARGSTTGFSDLDAILVVEDWAAEDPSALRSLRPRVIAVQRQILRFQPMQHHGFLVVTPKLLRRAQDALQMPPEALAETRSVCGRAVEATLDQRATSGGTRDSLNQLVAAVAAPSAWPSHPWRLHRLVSMYQLLPSLYLQASGRAVPKWDSFEQAREAFSEAWWPYDVLREAREVWPREPWLGLTLGTACTRNPWSAVAVWSRLPASPPREVARLLSPRCLQGLKGLGARMAREAG